MSATAERIAELLPAYFDDLLENFEEEFHSSAARLLGEMVQTGEVEQYRSYFIKGLRPQRPLFAEDAPTSVAGIVWDVRDVFTETTAGFTLARQGSIFLLTPMDRVAEKYLRENVADESSWYGRSLAIEARYVQDLVGRLRAEGFEVQEGS